MEGSVRPGPTVSGIRFLGRPTSTGSPPSQRLRHLQWTRLATTPRRIAALRHRSVFRPLNFNPSLYKRPSFLSNKHNLVTTTSWFSKHENFVPV